MGTPSQRSLREMSRYSFSQQRNTREKEYLEWSSKISDPGNGGEWVHQVRGPQERCPGTVLTAETYQREGIAREESGP
jgi:hypothetical protein